MRRRYGRPPRRRYSGLLLLAVGHLSPTGEEEEILEREQRKREKRENGMVGMKENGSYTLLIPTLVQLGRPSYHPNPLGLANRSSKARLAFPPLSLFCLLFNTPYLLPAPPLLYFIFLMFLCTSSVIFLPLALHFVNSHAF